MSDGHQEGATGRRGATSDRRRSAARLAAVQALYEMDMSGAAADAVLREFLEDRWRPRPDSDEADDSTELAGLDSGFFCDVVRGTSERRETIDRMVAAALSREWTLERLQSLVRTVLRAGAYELLARPDVPPKVVISEYIDVAHAFFAGNEPKFVNGVLDRLAHVVREQELPADGHERSHKTR